MGMFNGYKQRKAGKKKEEVVKNSLTLYQIQEYGSELWLTYDGHLVCPCSMLSEKPVEAVEKMRALYIERTPKISIL